MALERIILNIIPAGDMPVFHCSQYENGRPVIIDLVSSDDDAYIVPEGVTVELHCRKCDDTIVTMEPDEVDNNTVTFVTSEQLTACPGNNLCELVLYSDTDPVQTLATLNFILHVEPDPLAGGLTSESEIANLTQQIEDIAQEVIGNDYYNKTEVDGLISGVESHIPTKTSDLTNDSGYITSSDLTPYAKTADLATVATTGDYDDLLNKPDIDAMIAAALLEVMPVGTETGPIASFDTEIAAPLVNVSCDIVATGGYDADTQTAHPINGYTEANITANGNTYTIVFGQTVYGGVLDVTSGKLHVTWGGVDLGSQTWTYNSSNSWRSPISDSVRQTNPNTRPNWICSHYHISTQNNPTFPSLSGLDWFTGVCFWSNDYTTAEQVKTAMNGVILVYELATPFDIDLTPEVISAVVGTNNVYTDTNGGTTVQFKDSIQHYIDTRV